MAELSPAAQVVLDATFDHWPGGHSHPHKRVCLAVALRAVADQVQMKEPFGDTDADAGVFAAHQAIHAYLLTIADELDS